MYETNRYPVADAVFYRSYSRTNNSKYESWKDVITRSVDGLKDIGKLNDKEYDLLIKQALNCQCLPSGRWLWIGGTDWSKKPENYYGGYNCSGNVLDDVKVFGYLMNLAMQGCGTGVILEQKYLDKLPVINNKLNVEVIGNPGNDESTQENTTFSIEHETYFITVGDSRQGWVDSYQHLIDLSVSKKDNTPWEIIIDISHVRPEGERLKGFGGAANPIKLKDLYPKIADILNGAVGRKLNAEECTLLIDEAALVVVAGNIRRSAGIKQYNSTAPLLKLGLWEHVDGNWGIDPKKDSLRMSNHTRVFHQKPTLEQMKEAVKLQFESGEGAVMWAGESIARSNADILDDDERKLFCEYYTDDVVPAELSEEYLQTQYFKKYGKKIEESELRHRLSRYSLNPCGEIIGHNFFCNLSEIHLNRLNPLNFDEQLNAFKAGAIGVCSLLHHKFHIDRFTNSRELDPIVGVSFTGLFDFFVNLFGADWLEWWNAGRDENWDKEYSEKDKVIIKELGVEDYLQHNDLYKKADYFKTVERWYLKSWKEVVKRYVINYCEKHNLKIPNRFTTIQPAGSKSLLSNASPGWHPPKASRYIRRVTFRKNDPVALAHIDLGYSVIPSQSDKDDDGKLLDNPYDERCTEWLVEIPVETVWANIPGCDEFDISQFSAVAQFDFYMQCQQHYTTHNTSGTLEVRESEIDDLATAIYESIQNDEGYISSAILARFDNLETYPRLPFEPISKRDYVRLKEDVLRRRKFTDFQQRLEFHAQTHVGDVAPSGCDSDKCLISDIPKKS